MDPLCHEAISSLRTQSPLSQRLPCIHGRGLSCQVELFENATHTRHRVDKCCLENRRDRGGFFLMWRALATCDALEFCDQSDLRLSWALVWRMIAQGTGIGEMQAIRASIRLIVGVCTAPVVLKPVTALLQFSTATCLPFCTERVLSAITPPPAPTPIRPLSAPIPKTPTHTRDSHQASHIQGAKKDVPPALLNRRTRRVPRSLCSTSR